MQNQNQQQADRASKGRLRGAVLALCLSVSGVMAYAVTRPLPAPEVPGVRRVVEELPALNITARPDQTGYWQEEMVQQDDTLQTVLARLGVADRLPVHSLLRRNGIHAKLNEGQTVSVRVDSAGNATDIQFFNDDENGERNLVAIEKVNGKWQASEGAPAMETMPTLRSVVVRTSARGALAQAGVNVEIRESLSDIFSSRFALDSLKAGDQIRLLYHTLYFRGQEMAVGDILAAEVVKNGKRYQAYFYDQGDEGGSYYDENGKALKESGFRVQPVAAVRVSSPFGMRVHPITGAVKMHAGIDYAAPTGTPIYAAADAVVAFKGWQGGYGNTIVLRHSNGVETLHAHMSAFAPVGGSVKAGEVIGFVGSTGRSTGPHLHYEARINGLAVNPATVALPAPKMEQVNLAKFREQKKQADSLMAAIRGVPVTVAQLY
ncbi:M23 family metallopeptidase [Neisseria leonii]|uniref:M23 family metallopeptidase n=1 Tax=Neisseria leonii TaxID=2995413 RepID=UPI0030D3DE97